MSGSVDPSHPPVQSSEPALSEPADNAPSSPVSVVRPVAPNKQRPLPKLPLDKNGQPLQFYRRPLPAGCIAFHSAEGRQIFKEAIVTGHMEGYFGLAAQFRTQDEPAFCGVSTLVMVLNTLEVDPQRVWKGVWRWYHEEMLDCCVSLDVVAEKGINLEQFACLASCNTMDVKVTRPEQTTEEDFRDVVKTLTKQEEEVLVLSYSRRVIGQTGTGHFSPVGGYHPGKDLILMLDTARFKYPPHWVSVSGLWKAMEETDPDTGKSRGFITLRKSGLYPNLLFRLPEQWNVNIDNLHPNTKAFVSAWNAWLDTEATSPDVQASSMVHKAVQHLVTALSNMSTDGTHYTVLTTQMNTYCKVGLSSEHVCALSQLLQTVQACSVYQNVCEALPDLPAAAQQAGSCKGENTCQAKSTSCPKILIQVTAYHFLTVILLMWPYKRGGDAYVTHGALLHKITKKLLAQSTPILQNEICQLQHQLDSIFGNLGYTKMCNSSCCSAGKCGKNHNHPHGTCCL